MAISDPKPGERVRDVRFDSDTLSVDLADGRTITVPLTWYPRLHHATAAQRSNWKISAGGYGIHWPDIDEDLSTEGLLRGAPAPRQSRPTGTEGVVREGGMDLGQEYVSSVTLVILGETLDPDAVSHVLAFEPSQSWRKGEAKVHSPESRYERGGWKLFMDPAYKNELLEQQIQYWCDVLQRKIDVLDELKSQGMDCSLSVFIATDETASIAISPTLQESVASLGLELEISILAGNSES